MHPLGCALFRSAPPAPALRVAPPNIVIFLADDHGWDDLAITTLDDTMQYSLNTEPRCEKPDVAAIDNSGGLNDSLNVRNALNRDRLPVHRVLTTGEGAVYTVQEPRSFILTNTFSF